VARGRVAVGLVGLVVFAGCYASTEPATQVGAESAKLNARGTADKGEATSWFELEVTGRVGAPRHVGAETWPAGVSGPFSHTATGLAASTSYSFRVCGQDAYTAEVCAQTRTFTTSAPTEDSVNGDWWSGCCSSVTFKARSGPDGENSRGTVSWDRGSSWEPYSWHFGGDVTCLAVDGQRAVIGAVGTRSGGPDDTTVPATMRIVVVDGRTQRDRYADEFPQQGSTPPACDAPGLGEPFELDEQHEFVVNDAP
jgi:hypothetical protein